MNRDSLKSNIKSILLLCALLCNYNIQTAYAGPSGGEVVRGSADIEQSESLFNITQSTSKAAINWQDFSIAEDESVIFYQPDSTSVTLNRVTGNNLSEIYGSLGANGNIFLINPEGIIFGEGAEINVGGFLASTFDITDDDFMSEKYNFTIPGITDSSIINKGNISIADSGFAAFVAPHVSNSGIISARLGTVAVGSTEQGYSLDLYGDNLINFIVSDKTAESMAGSGLPGIENSGNITTDGGTVIMTAKTAGDILNNIIISGGEVRARSVEQKNGKIILSGNSNSSVYVSETAFLDASGADSKGGNIEISGKDILIEGELNATGAAGGGEILIGGDWQGSGSMFQAASTAITGSASLDASATYSGDGGKIVVWSDIYNKDSITAVNGTILAKGTGAGTGGAVETSGYKLDIGSDIFITAGSGGLWLLDPADSTINQATADGYVSTLNTGTSVLNEVAGNITLNDNVSIAKTAGGDAALTFKASGNIVLGAGSSINSESNKLNLVLWSDSDASNGGSIHIRNSSAINTNGGDISLVGGTDGNGYAEGTSTQTADPPHQDGISIYYSTLNSGGGAITIKGKGYAGNLAMHGGGIWTGGGIISTGGGDLVMDVQAQDDGYGQAGIRYGAYLDGTTISTNGGNMQISTASPSLTWTGFYNSGNISAGTGDITLSTDQISPGGTISGTGALTIQPITSSTSIGIAGGSGTLNINGAGLGVFQNGFSSITVGRSDGSGLITVNGFTFNDNLTLLTRNGSIQINGALNTGSNSLTLTSTGTVSDGVGGSITAGALNLTGTNGIFNLDSAVSNVTSLTGNTGSITFTDSNNLTLGTTTTASGLSLTLAGTLTTSGTVDGGAGSISLAANSIALGANIQGTGSLTLKPYSAGTTIGLAGGAGTLNLDSTELDYLQNGFSNITIGRSDGSGQLTINGYTFNDNLTLLTGSGGIQIDGALSTGSSNLTLTSTGTVADGAGGSITAAGLDLTGAGGIFNLDSSISDVDTLTGSTGSITFSDADQIILGDININGDITVEALNGRLLLNGDIIKDSGADATLTLKATSYITLADTSYIGSYTQDLANGFTSSIVSTNNKLNVVINPGSGGDPGSFWLPDGSSISTNGGNVTVGGDAGAGSYAIGTNFVSSEYNSLLRGISINGTINAGGGDITLKGQGSPSAGVNAARGVHIGGTVSTTGTGNINISGTGKGTSDGVALGDDTDAGSGTISAENGTITITGAKNTGSEGIELTESTSLITTTGTGSLVLNSTGDIKGVGIFDIGGTTALTAGSDDITLNNTSNDFTGAVSVVSGNNVTLNDTSALVLGASTINGDLALITGGAITQTGALDANGTTSFTAGSGNNVTLTNNSNDFTGAVTVVSGNQVSLVDTNSMELGTTSLNDIGTSLTAETLAGALTVGGVISRSSGANDIDLTLTVAGGSTLLLNNSITNNANAAVGKLNILLDADDITIDGTTTISSNAGTISIGDPGNSNGNLDSSDATPRGLTVNATGAGGLSGDITLNGSLGATSPLSTLNVWTYGYSPEQNIYLNGGTYKTTGNQNYIAYGTMVFGADTSILTGGGNLKIEGGNSTSRMRSALSGNYSLTINTTDGTAADDGYVVYGNDAATGSGGFNYLGGVDITTYDASGGEAGDLFFFLGCCSNSHVAVDGDFNYLGGDVYLGRAEPYGSNNGRTINIDTNPDNLGASGNVNLYNAATNSHIIAPNDGGTLNVDTSSTDNIGGNITIGEVTGNGGNQQASNVSLNAAGTTGGTLTLHGDIKTSGNLALATNKAISSAQKFTIGGTANFTAGSANNITLNNAGNDFIGSSICSFRK